MLATLHANLSPVNHKNHVNLSTYSHGQQDTNHATIYTILIYLTILHSYTIAPIIKDKPPHGNKVYTSPWTPLQNLIWRWFADIVKKVYNVNFFDAGGPIKKIQKSLVCYPRVLSLGGRESWEVSEVGGSELWKNNYAPVKSQLPFDKREAGARHGTWRWNCRSRIEFASWQLSQRPVRNLGRKVSARDHLDWGTA